MLSIEVAVVKLTIDNMVHLVALLVVASIRVGNKGFPLGSGTLLACSSVGFAILLVVLLDRCARVGHGRRGA